MGNKILDASGHQFIPYGININGLSYPNWQKNMASDDAEIQAAGTAWHANTLRIQVDPAAMLEATPYDGPMMTQLEAEVSMAEGFGMVVIITLQNENEGGLPAPLPDASSVAFWKVVGQQFAADGRVWFDPFNEPRLAIAAPGQALGSVVTNPARTGQTLLLGSSSAIWRQWNAGGYGFLGLQSLVDTIRSVAPSNMILAEPERDQLDGLIPLKGTNIAYAPHPYFDRKTQPSSWDRLFGDVAKLVPVVADEWNQYDSTLTECSPNGPTLTPEFLSYLRDEGIGIVAWGIGTPGALVTSKGAYDSPTSFTTATYGCTGSTKGTPKHPVPSSTASPPQGAGTLLMAYFVQYG